MSNVCPNDSLLMMNSEVMCCPRWQTPCLGCGAVHGRVSRVSIVLHAGATSALRTQHAATYTADNAWQVVNIGTAPMERLATFIVEDSLIIRENLIATLHELVPVEVVGTAEDDVTAIRWLKQRHMQVDLVILDTFLKHGSGLGVLRASAELPQVRAKVVLTNYATDEMRSACLELGADKVFDKSSEIDALILYCDELASDGGDGF